MATAQNIEMKETRVSLIDRNISQDTTGSLGNIIDIDQLVKMIEQKDYIRGFALIDENRDGLLDVRELKRMFRRLGNKLPQDVIDKIMALSDQDNDGYLDYNEFVTMMNHPKFKDLCMRYCGWYIDTIVPHGKTRRQVSFDAVDGFYDEVDGAYERKYKLWPPPLGMISISAIILTLFLIDAFVYESKTGHGPIADVLIYNPKKRDEFWRYLSYMFVHIGETHLSVNILVQILLGIPLEMVHKSWRVLIVYLFGVIAGSLGTSVTDPYVLLAGASGGVYSLLTAHIANVVLNWKEMSFAIAQLLLFLIIGIADAGSAIYERYHLQKKTNVGYVAHFAGALAGLLVGIFVLRNLEWNTCEKTMWWFALFTFGGFMIFAIFWNIFNPDYYPH